MDVVADATIGFRRKLSALWAVTLLATMFCLNGCSDSTQPTSGNLIQGRVYGGRQAIVGSTVQVFASSGQNSSSPIFLGSATTDSTGGFNLTSFNATPSTGDLVYAVALGGDAGNGSNNSNISLMSVAGLYGNALSNIHINELTTVAAASQLSPYMVQVPCNTLTGNAALSDQQRCPQINGLESGWNTIMSKISALIDLSSGALITSNANDVQNINLQASVLANCVNSTGGSAGDSTACGNLMSNPNASFSSLSSASVQGYAAFRMALSPKGDFLYVINQSNYGVSTIQSDHGALTWINDVNFPALNSYPQGVAVSPNGNVVAVIDYFTSFTVLQSSSAGLSPLNGTLSASMFHSSSSNFSNLIFSQDGSQLFVLDAGSTSVYSYAFSNGQPVLSTVQLVQAGTYSWALALSPDGQYLYVCDLIDNTITVYATSSGTLTPINGSLAASSFATGTRPYAVTVSPDGKYVYVANSPTSGSGSISVFASNAGQLTAVGSPVATGGTLRAIAISPDGNYLAVSIATPIVGFYIYQVNAGQLTFLKSVTTTRSPRELKFSPNGQYLYATVPGTIGAAQGYIYSYTTQNQAANDTLSALLNLHSIPSTGAAISYSLLPSQPVFTPIPASQPSTLVIP
jgi:6-phosphogluconolactonase (cycloisomerase 2 family)